MRRLTFALLVCLLSACSKRSISSDIEAELEHTKAIDNHAHPMRVVARGEQDREFDALPADAVQILALPVPAQPDNPMFAQARKELFDDQDKAAVARQKGDSYPVWILNQT